MTDSQTKERLEVASQAVTSYQQRSMTAKSKTPGRLHQLRLELDAAHKAYRATLARAGGVK